MASIVSGAVFCAMVFCTPVQAEDSATAPAVENPQSYFGRMANYISAARQFQVSMRLGYDVVQESGQKLEFSERRRITVVRPDRLRVDIEKSDGEKAMVLYDGKKITAYSETHQVYAEAEIAGTIRDALVYFLRDLQMRMPLAIMLTENFPAEMESRVEELAFVEISAITDTPSVHLAGRTAQIDFQMWIPRTGNPLLRRVVITYRDEEGQPNFWADFLDWNLSPAITDQTFAFAPPAGAEQIPFLALTSEGSMEENLKGGD
jgi:hypothetical protein